MLPDCAFIYAWAAGPCCGRPSHPGEAPFFILPGVMPWALEPRLRILVAVFHQPQNGRARRRSNVTTSPEGLPNLPCVFYHAGMIQDLEQSATRGESLVGGEIASQHQRDLPPKALIDGVSRTSSSADEKFAALAEDWENHNFGRPVIDFNHIAHFQIIGMGQPAVRPLIERVARGEGKWIYSLKCITGEEAETPEMHGNGKEVIQAWAEWERRNGYIR